MKILSRSVLLFAALIVAVPVLAQDARGRIQGTIIDKTGADVPGASVTLTNDATGITVTSQSGDNGRYLFNQIDPGVYTITIQQRGFKTVVQKNIQLHSRGDVTADITLEVSDIAETVTIESGAANVQFNTTNHELTVEQTFFKQLPLATRSPANLIALDPTTNVRGRNSAAVANFDHYALNAFDIGGRSAGANDVLIDGSPLANSSKLGYNPPLDAVAELTVKQNAVDAEFGHSAGGILTISMKSGTNQIHGSAYYFGRNQDWNALSNRTTRQHSRNNFWNGGATVGLPIIKNKLFLFSSYEKQTDTSFRALSYTLPTALERQGDFSQSVNANGSPRIIYDPLTSRIVNNVIVRDPFPGNKIPQNRWDGLAARMLSNLWGPNNAGDDRTGLNNYKYEDYRYYRYYNLSNRVDWQIKENWKAFGRVSFFRTNQPANDYTNGADKLKMRRTEGSTRHGMNIAADTVYTFSPTTLLTLSGSYYKTIDRRNYPEMAIGEAGYQDLWPSGWWKSYATDRPLIYFPNFQIPSGDTFGVRNFWWQQPFGYSLGGVLNKQLNDHSLKFGSNVRLKRGDAARYFFANMAFTFNNTANTTAGALTTTGHPWASFLLGALDPGGSSVNFIPLQQANTEMYAFFVQDDYKLSRRLTLNLGLRYEYEGGYWDSQNRIPQNLDLTNPIPGMQAAIDPKIAALAAGTTGKTVAQLMAESAGQKSYLYNGAFYFTEDDNKRATQSDPYQFMPRLGLAYRLDDKTAIRFGYGRFYTPNSLADGGNEPLGSLDLGSFSPTTNVLPALQGVPQAYLSNPFPQGLTQPVGKAYGRYTNLGDNITIDEYERRPPISDRINFSVQREIWGRTVVDVTYFKNFVSRDQFTVNLNMVDPRLSYKYGAELSRTVANPFFNYGTEATFPGALRRQSTVSVATLLKAYPQYGNLTQTSTDLGKFRNQSLQIRVQRPHRSGFSYLVTYAYVLANAQLYYDEQDQYDGILTRYNEPDPRHRIVGSGTYELPIGRSKRFGGNMHRALDLAVGGWQLATTYTYRSGAYLRFGSMLAPQSVKQSSEVGSNKYWFDITGFTRLPAFTRRTNPLQYDNLKGPNFSNVDAVLSKKFNLTEKFKLEFRLEAYNALNGMNFGTPNLNITASDFGRTNAQAPDYFGRQLQYMFRLEF
jgi:hypothetical protein